MLRVIRMHVQTEDAGGVVDVRTKERYSPLPAEERHPDKWTTSSLHS